MSVPPPKLDWFVFAKKTALMQRLGDLVRTGHVFYVEGTIELAKAPYFAGKIDQLYQAGQTRLVASRRRATGDAAFRLLMLSDEPGKPLRWWLLRTVGNMPAEAHREKWRDALKDRIKLTGYELVRQPRPGKAVASWTWRYTKEREEDLRHAIVRAVRTRRDDELRQLVQSIWRTPGFAAARAQVKKMGQLIVGEWKRSRGNEPMFDLPTRMGYVRRLPDVGLKLSALEKVAKMTQEAR